MNFPDELLLITFKNLPLKELKMCSKVCRRWFPVAIECIKLRMKRHLLTWKNRDQWKYGPVTEQVDRQMLTLVLATLQLNIGGTESIWSSPVQRLTSLLKSYKFIPKSWLKNNCEVYIPWSWFDNTMLKVREWTFSDNLHKERDVLDALYIEGDDITKVEIYTHKNKHTIWKQTFNQRDVVCIYLPFILPIKLMIFDTLVFKITAKNVRKFQTRQGSVRYDDEMIHMTGPINIRITPSKLLSITTEMIVSDIRQF